MEIEKNQNGHEESQEWARSIVGKVSRQGFKDEPGKWQWILDTFGNWEKFNFSISISHWKSCRQNLFWQLGKAVGKTSFGNWEKLSGKPLLAFGKSCRENLFWQLGKVASPNSFSN
jgi:hypothetical protein